MVRLIDADALKRDMKNNYLNAMECIDEQLSIVEILPEKEGTWSEEYDPDDDALFRRKYRCSACNGWNTYGFTRYCPECGAKMRNAHAKTD